MGSEMCIRDRSYDRSCISMRWDGQARGRVLMVDLENAYFGGIVGLQWKHCKYFEEKTRCELENMEIDSALGPDIVLDREARSVCAYVADERSYEFITRSLLERQESQQCAQLRSDIFSVLVVHGVF